MSTVPELVRRLERYCQRKGRNLGRQLGFGVHGSVFVAEDQIDGRSTAVKAHEREKFYRRERKVHSRLKEFSVSYIDGASVPELVGHDDELWAIEMTIVTRPFALDFAGAYLAPTS